MGRFFVRVLADFSLIFSHFLPKKCHFWFLLTSSNKISMLRAVFLSGQSQTNCSPIPFCLAGYTCGSEGSGFLMKPMIDSFGRVVTNLRISVTDRCNFRCRYCMPEEGMRWLPKEALLSYEELARVAKVFVDLGVRKIRLTGGEPLMRHDLDRLVGFLSSITQLEDLALTTNGFFLPERIDELAKAGLRRLHVSLDS